MEGGETVSKPIYKMVDGKTRENREQGQELGSWGLGGGHRGRWPREGDLEGRPEGSGSLRDVNNWGAFQVEGKASAKVSMQ